MMNLTWRAIFFIAAVLLPGVAQAHPAFDSHGFATGFVHPLAGADHFLAMIAVGVWSASLGGRARWIVPMSFVATMGGGAIAGLLGVALPAHDYAIAASVVTLGLLVASHARVPTPAAAVFVALLAFAHGYAHAIEAPASGSLEAFGAGFVISTIVLHIVGLGIGAFALRGSTTRIAGMATAAAGAYFVMVA